MPKVVDNFFASDLVYLSIRVAEMLDKNEENQEKAESFKLPKSSSITVFVFSNLFII